MESTRNVTLSLPERVLKKAKHIAVEREISLSKLLSEYIEAIVDESEAYEEARRRARAWLERGFPVDEAPNDYAWTREELHDRG
ncbi:MAG: DUF6364 family protein [Clostridia bacterium]